MICLKGITWGHIRAYDPLRAAAEEYLRQRGVHVVWENRDLRAFEHQPLSEVVKQYDLVVYDYPHSGMVFSGSLFSPLNDIEALGTDKEGDYIGPSLASYRYQDKQYGAPLDGATTHGLYRADLLARLDRPVPRSWQEAIDLGREARARGLYLALPVAAPHGYMAIAALCSNMGYAVSLDPEKPFCMDRGALRRAVELFDSLWACCHPECLSWNSISLHNHMAVRDDIVYCPCVYGYAVYGENGIYEHRLSFSDFAGAQEPFCAGSALGGTGLAVSADSPNQEAAMEYTAWMMRPEVQMDIFCRHHGQPGRVEGWHDAGLDALTNGFYSGARKTMETAWVRPRFQGYLFEAEAAAMVEAHVHGEIPAKELVDRICSLAERYS